MSELPKNVNDFIGDAARTVGSAYVENFIMEIEHHLYDDEPAPESPIGQILSVAIRSVINIDEWDSPPWIEIKISCQEKIGKYRADFLILYSNGKGKGSIIVECDGHEFHDRDEKQRRYENKRDRYFQMHGYRVFHYTGSEIVNNPFVPACEIVAEANGSSVYAVMLSIINHVPEKYRKSLSEIKRDPSKTVNGL